MEYIHKFFSLPTSQLSKIDFVCYHPNHNPEKLTYCVFQSDRHFIHAHTILTDALSPLSCCILPVFEVFKTRKDHLPLPHPPCPLPIVLRHQVYYLELEHWEEVHQINPCTHHLSLSTVLQCHKTSGSLES